MLAKLRPIKLNSSGDTIVEVIFVLAILGLALSICYATANASLDNIRQAQDNATATQLVADQIEALRLENDNSNIYTYTGFCLTQPSPPVPGTPFNVNNPVNSNCESPVNGTPPGSPGVSLITVTDYFCGGPLAAGEAALSGPVPSACTQANISNNTDTFLIIGSWQDPDNANLQDAVTQAYRVHVYDD